MRSRRLLRIARLTHAGRGYQRLSTIRRCELGFWGQPVRRAVGSRPGWRASGHEVLYGSRAVDKAKQSVAELNARWGDRVANLHPCDNAWACDAPVVILAVNADSAIPTVHEHAERLQGKIVVSMANNLVKHGNEFNAVLPPHGSVAAEIQALLWRSHVCTAFHLVPAAEFADLDHTMESDVVVLGDQDDAKTTLMEITSSIPNLRPLDGGSLRNAVGMETFAAVLLTVNIRHKMRASLRLTTDLIDGARDAVDLTGRVVDRHRRVTGDRQGSRDRAWPASARRSCARPVRSVETPGGLPGTIHDTVREIEAAGGTAIAIRCDIGDAADITALVDATVAQFGGLDVLVNNAMSPTQALFAESTVERVGRVDARQRAQPLPVHACGRPAHDRAGRRQHRQHLVARRRPRDHAVHAARLPLLLVAKAALERFSSALAPELAPLGIVVNALRPGAVKTEMTELEFGPDHDWSGWTTPDAVVAPVATLVAAARHRLHRPDRRRRRLRQDLGNVVECVHLGFSRDSSALRHRPARGRARSTRRTWCACTCAGSRPTTRRTSATPRPTSPTTS